MILVKNIRIADESPNVERRQTANRPFPLFRVLPCLFRFWTVYRRKLFRTKSMALLTKRAHRWHDALSRFLVVLASQKSLLISYAVSVGGSFAGVRNHYVWLRVVTGANGGFQRSLTNKHISSRIDSERLIQNFSLLTKRLALRFQKSFRGLHRIQNAVVSSSLNQNENQNKRTNDISDPVGPRSSFVYYGYVVRTLGLISGYYCVSHFASLLGAWTRRWNWGRRNFLISLPLLT